MKSAGIAAVESVVREHGLGARRRVVAADGTHRGMLLAQGLRSGDVWVCLARDAATAHAIAEEAAFFAGLGRDAQGPGSPIAVLPEVDVSPWAEVSPDPRHVAARMAMLDRLARSDVRVLVASVASWMRRVVPRAAFDTRCATLAKGVELPRDEALDMLQAAGFVRSDRVEDPGTYAVRGMVLDLYSPTERFPTRIEWWDDEIERVRRFDPDTQRSLGDLDEVRILPVRETVATAEVDLRKALLELGDRIEVPSSRTRQVLEYLERGMNFFGIDALLPLLHGELASVESYLDPNARWLVDEPEAVLDAAERIEAHAIDQHARAVANRQLVMPPDAFFASYDHVRERIEAAKLVTAAADIEDPERDDGRRLVRIALDSNLELRTRLEASRLRKGGEVLRPLVDHIEGLGGEAEGPDGQGKSDPWDVVLVAPNETHAERLAAALRGYGLGAEAVVPTGHPLALSAGDLARTRVRVIAGPLARGFCSPRERVLLLGAEELFGARARRARRARRRHTGLASLSQLAVDDFVVHVHHGIGQYRGLTHLSVGGVDTEFVHIEYGGKGDRLYLPVHRIAEIERYMAADGKAPKLDKLGGHTFAAKAKKIRADVRQMAEELLQIYAQREALEGFAHPEPSDADLQFEGSFPFEETPDQAEAIESVHEDLGRHRPMDRLVCGDVGFGKTEVALRGTFRVAMGGHQVAVLAPTTVLVQQHFVTFSERMAPFGVNVAVLNRFVTGAQRKKVLAQIQSGEVDVVIGTHRLLSRDVRFKRLGLVVIDEEQRFGVAQKERFKRLKTEVDVLTLTATPIPRTLHMALLGLREISMITTPPVDRLAVRTNLSRQGDRVIEEGLRTELARGGQAFYVVPRILGIEEHALRIRELVPDARVVVAHGQMPAELLEKTMVDFIEHRADVLVCTTIIESGLDIPRANTMFIANADRFGLAQLYQLRGRIGRSRLRAHCYLMVDSIERLSPEAKRRLEAIARHTGLGEGFNVASRDLEIRGAGDLLGKRQSGSIQALGYAAYARILEEAVAELRGEPILRETDPELAIDVPAYLPDTWIDDTASRLDFYRRMAVATDAAQVREVVAELVDRFGELPLEAQHYGLVMACKTWARTLGAIAVELAGTRFSLRLGSRTPLSPEQAVGLAKRTGGRLKLVGGERVVAKVPERTGEDCTRVLEACESHLVELARIAEGSD